MRGVLTAAITLVVMVIAGLTETSCAKRAPGTCAEDIDCAPGHDCRGGACVRRERMKFGVTPARPDATPGADPSTTAPITAPDHQVAPSAPDADAGTDARAQRRSRITPSPAPAEPPSVPSPALPAPGREPMWKQRLKNS